MKIKNLPTSSSGKESVNDLHSDTNPSPARIKNDIRDLSTKGGETNVVNDLLKGSKKEVNVKGLYINHGGSGRGNIKNLPV